MFKSVTRETTLTQRAQRQFQDLIINGLLRPGERLPPERDLAKQLGIIPTPPENDTSLESQAKAVAMLQSKSGAAFDKAYLKHEIAFHQSVISAIKGTLLPAIKSEQFKALVTKVLPGFEHHLAATKAAARKLGIE